MAPIGGGAEVVGFARDDHGDAVLMRQAHGMCAAHVRNLLTGAVVSIVEKAGSGFRNDAAFRGSVEIAAFHLFYVIGQQLHAVRIHAAQVGGDQRFRNEVGDGAREGGGFEQASRPGREVFG